ncbi:cobalamin biosynthesis protein CobW, partial [Lachnotalea glycerini]
HDEACCGHDHNHEHGEACCSHDHPHEHDEECCGHDHHHEHDEECCGHDHHHEHDEECCGHDHDHEGHHHADEVFTSWGKETPRKYNKSALEEILKKLANTTDFGVVLRAKGIVQSDEGTWMQFDLVPGEYEIRDGEPDYTGRLCVIGTKLKESEIETLFNR